MKIPSLAAALLLSLLIACHPQQPRVDPGGAYLLLAVDTDAVAREHLEDVSERMADLLRNAGIRYVGHGASNDAARITLRDAADLPRAVAALAPITAIVFSSDASAATVEARIDPASTHALVATAIPEIVQVLQRRLSDQAMSVEGWDNDRVLIRTSQQQFPDWIRNAVTKPGRVTFHLVREVDIVDTPSLRPGTMLAQPYPEFGNRPEVVRRRPEIDAGHLQHVGINFDPTTQMPAVQFQLDREGTRRFCHITREHLNQRFAVLLDGQVLTAPLISEPICGGSGQISGNFTRQGASAMAIMLRAGALPAPLAIVGEGIGPSWH